MKQRQWVTILRWFCVIPAAILGFGVSIVFSIPFNMLVPHGLLGSLQFPYALALDGALAASLTIQFGVYTAPWHKNVVALVLFLLGAIIAWLLVGELYWPMHVHQSQAARTWLPITGTYLGGIVTCVWIWFISKSKRNVPGSTSAPLHA